MTTQAIDHKLKLYRITSADRAALKALRPHLERNMGRIVDGFYNHLGEFPEAVAIIEKAGSSIERLKKTNPGYFAQIFDAEFGPAYFESRKVIGQIHARIGLEPTFFFAAMTSYVDTIFPMVLGAHRFNSAKAARQLGALQKAFVLDQSLIMDAYIAGSVAELLHVTEETSDVIGRLRVTSGNLHAAGSESASAVARVASVVDELAAATESQAQSTSQMSEQMQSVSKGSESMKLTLEDQNAALEQAQEQIRSTQEKVAEIDRQAAVWQELRKRMVVLESMKGSVTLTSERVKEMNDRSDEIGRIVQTIDGIAEQTNLLALNAAIEAARAGEHGRGFAVVAEQVRKLAEDSSNATREITDLVGKVQAGASGSFKAMQEALEGVTLVTELTTDAAACLERISTTAAEVSVLNESVTGAMSKVNTAAHHNETTVFNIVGEIRGTDESLQNIAAITEENSSATHEVSAAAHQMQAQVEELLEAVNAINQEIEALQFISTRARNAAESLGKAA